MVGAVYTTAVSTENPLFSVADWLSGLVTVTFRGPTVALDAIEMLAAICVLETNAQEFTVIPAPKAQPGEAWKLVPPRDTPRLFWPWEPLLGVTVVNDGAG